MASREEIKSLRSKGIEVSADLTKSEYKRLAQEVDLIPKQYRDEELFRIYERYAGLKGWQTDRESILTHICNWKQYQDQAVEMAIKFHESGIDQTLSGYDAAVRFAVGSDRILQLGTSIVQSEYRNDDGTNRQEIIERCHQFEQLTLTHLPGTSGDCNRIKVCRADGEQLGFLSKSTAAAILDRAKRGYVHCAYFWKEKNRLIIAVADPGVATGEILDYAKRWIFTKT